MLHKDRLPSVAHASLIDKFRFMDARKEAECPPMELGADCYFALGVMLSESACEVFVGGPSSGAYVAQPWPDADYVFVRFRPGRMPRLLDVSAKDLLDRSVGNIRRLLGQDMDNFCERLLRAPDPASRQRLLEDLLAPLLERPLCQDRRCLRALDHIDRGYRQVTVGEVAQDLGMSPRTLLRLFLDQVGLPPKRVLRHLRFQRAFEHIQRAEGNLNFADLAGEYGYTDQSHLIRECRLLAGKRPTELLAGLAPRPC